MLSDISDILSSPVDLAVALAETIFPDGGLVTAFLASLASLPLAYFAGVVA